MKLSKKSRYALRALIDLSIRSKKEYVTLSTIAERNEISQQYLEHIFASLKRGKIVKSIKGPQGGYSLNKSAKKIKVAEILQILEGEYAIEGEVSNKGSSLDLMGLSIQTLIIDRINISIDQILQEVTLEDLEKDYVLHYQDISGMYYI